MVFSKATGLLTTAFLLTGVAAHSEDDYEHMGPLGFMWPGDREWSEEDAMTAPCGVSGGVVNRTEFPIVNGALALEQKQQVFDVQISIALDEDPTAETEFQVIVPSDRIQSLEYSHVCLSIPDLVPDATDGANATIQLRYTAEYIDPDHHHRRHLPVNETFYACADVTLVREEAFTLDIPCFNVTAEYDENETESEHSHDDDDDDDDDEHEDEDDDDDGDDSGLGSGDIAGIVVGSVVGAAVIATVAWYLWRRDRREKQVAQHIMAENTEK